MKVYRIGETNHCPGCGRTHWIIGRATAECAFCMSALPLETITEPRAPLLWKRGQGGGKVSRMAVAA